MWVFSLQMSDYTGQRGNTALVHLIFLATARYCSLAHPRGLPLSIVLMGVVKKTEQAGPHHSTGRMVVSLCRPLLHYEKMVSCLMAPRPVACLEVEGARKNGRAQYFQVPATQGYLGRSQKKIRTEAISMIEFPA